MHVDCWISSRAFFVSHLFLPASANQSSATDTSDVPEEEEEMLNVHSV